MLRLKTVKTHIEPIVLCFKKAGIKWTNKRIRHRDVCAAVVLLCLLACLLCEGWTVSQPLLGLHVSYASSALTRMTLQHSSL